MNRAALKSLEAKITDSTELSAATKKEMLDEVRLAKNPLDTDKVIYWIVVGGLVAAIITSLAFTFVLSLSNPTPKIPEIFMAIGSAAVGALAGLLAPSPRRGGDD